jgi:hypothetical protein
MEKFFKIFSYKIIAIVLIIISAFVPIAKIIQNGIEDCTETVIFFSKEELIFVWAVLLILVILANITKYIFKKVEIIYKIMIICNIAWVLYLWIIYIMERVVLYQLIYHGDGILFI